MGAHSSFAATVGQFVLALALRMQLAAVVDGQPRVSEKRYAASPHIQGFL